MILNLFDPLFYSAMASAEAEYQNQVQQLGNDAAAQVPKQDKTERMKRWPGDAEDSTVAKSPWRDYHVDEDTSRVSVQEP